MSYLLLTIMREEIPILDPLLSEREYRVVNLYFKSRERLQKLDVLSLKLHFLDGRGRHPGNNSVKPAQASPQRNRTGLVSTSATQVLAALKNDLATMRRDMINTSLTDLGVVRNPPAQQSSSKDRLK